VTGTPAVTKGRTTMERMEELQPVAPYIALLLFVISVIFSSFPSTAGYLFLWAMTGLAGVLFLRLAYPRGFSYGLWLLAIYILSGVGAFLISGFVLGGVQGIVIGLLLEILAIYTIYQLIVEIKGIRDAIEGPRVSLGLWTLAVVLFFLTANGAMGSLASWVRSGGNLYGYMALEMLAVLLVLFISARTEVCVFYFEEGPLALRRRAEPPAVSLESSTEKVIRSARDVASRTRKAIAPSSKAKGAASGTTGPCPLCSSPRKVVMRTCPNCGVAERTAVCDGSGHVFIPCPSCGRANYTGDYRCKKCDGKLGELILCRKCGKEADLGEWRVVGAGAKGQNGGSEAKAGPSETSTS